MESTDAPVAEAEAPPIEPEVADGGGSPQRDWAWTLVVLGVALLLAACAALMLMAASRAPVGAPG